MKFKILTVGILYLAFFGCLISKAFAHSVTATASIEASLGSDSDQPEDQVAGRVDEYETDIHRLIALRSHPLDELIALAVLLEAKWRRLNWNQYAVVMGYVCSEISNRGLNDPRVRDQTEHFARVALSHSNMYLWEHQATLVGALGYQRSSHSDSDWLRERREKAELWLQAWQRLEKEFDPSFDLNDRKSLPSMRVWPPDETGLPAGAPPSAIKDPKLRAQYELAINANKRKAQRVDQQLPLVLHGPSFRARAEHSLIELYTQPPSRTTELKQYLQLYLKDRTVRQRILHAVEKNSKWQSKAHGLKAGFSGKSMGEARRTNLLRWDCIKVNTASPYPFQYPAQALLPCD